MGGGRRSWRPTVHRQRFDLRNAARLRRVIFGTASRGTRCSAGWARSGTSSTGSTSRHPAQIGMQWATKPCAAARRTDPAEDVGGSNLGFDDSAAANPSLQRTRQSSVSVLRRRRLHPGQRRHRLVYDAVRFSARSRPRSGRSPEGEPRHWDIGEGDVGRGPGKARDGRIVSERRDAFRGSVRNPGSPGKRIS